MRSPVGEVRGDVITERRRGETEPLYCVASDVPGQSCSETARTSPLDAPTRRLRVFGNSANIAARKWSGEHDDHSGVSPPLSRVCYNVVDCV